MARAADVPLPASAILGPAPSHTLVTCPAVLLAFHPEIFASSGIRVASLFVNGLYKFDPPP